MEAEILEATTQELMMHDYPSDCCPEGCYLKFPCIAGDPDSPFWQGWGNLRIKTFRLIENKYFEMAVITMILISSLALVSMIFISLPSSCFDGNFGKVYFFHDFLWGQFLQDVICKFHDFLVTQILREINFGESRSSKNAVFAIFGALNLVIW